LIRGLKNLTLTLNIKKNLFSLIKVDFKEIGILGQIPVSQALTPKKGF